MMEFALEVHWVGSLWEDGSSFRIIPRSSSNRHYPHFPHHAEGRLGDEETHANLRPHN